MKVEAKKEVIHSTIGDLIEAMMQVAIESGKTQQEGYKLTAAAIESILNRRRRAAVVIH